MKFLILLAGCGLGDGSAIEEVILVYATLDKYNIKYVPIAQDKSFTSVNHLTKEPSEVRIVLAESARIGRGLIQDIEGINCEDYDALIIPSGVGLINNYQDSEVVFKLIIDFGRLAKPVGTMCAGIDLLRKWKGPNLMNEEIKELKANDFFYDQEHRAYYTPAFRKSSNIFEIQEGIDKMILSIIMDLNE